MAARSHSRFVDEVYSTPAPTQSKIPVKTKPDVHDEIFPANYFPEFREGLYAAEEVNSRELFDKYPANFKSKNKQFIYKLMNEKHAYRPLPDKSILITRWKPFVPIVETEKVITEFKYDSHNFQYTMADDGRTIDWYLNFADSDLFAYYAGELLAQDELQVLECVELASLREYLTQTINTVGTSTVGADTKSGNKVPTPMLICNAERVLQLDTKDIYGNKFPQATEEQLQNALRRIEKPQPVNLIAMEAPSYGRGAYKRDEIRLMLTTAYTAFKAAQILGRRAYEMNNLRLHPNRRRDDAQHLRTVIHTGWWGCGAYGNHPRMSLITQQLAARWAQIERLVFYDVKDKRDEAIQVAETFTESMKNERSVDRVIDEILKLNIEWGRSNKT